MSLINTYQIATCGQNYLDSCNFASNGILLKVTIEDIPPVIEIPDEIINSGDAGRIQSYVETETKKKPKRKCITVHANVQGKEYIETICVENKPTLTLKDVKVEVTEQTDKKPKIKISIDL